MRSYGDTDGEGVVDGVLEGMGIVGGVWDGVSPGGGDDDDDAEDVAVLVTAEAVDTRRTAVRSYRGSGRELVAQQVHALAALTHHAVVWGESTTVRSSDA